MSDAYSNVYSIFEAAANRYPDHIAIVDGARQCTYAQLRLEVERMAQLYAQRGLREGHRVLVFVPMGIDLYRSVLALFKMGATAVFLDEWVSWRRMELCAQLADCQGFVAPFWIRWLSVLSGPLRRIPVRISPPKWLGTGAVAGSHFNVQKTAHGGATAALITFTTGSTGTPKAALRSHDFLRTQFEVLREEIRPQPSDVDMTTLPIVLLINLGVGATSIIARFKPAKPASMRPADVLAQLNDHQVVRITASPYFVERLAAHVSAQRGQVAPTVLRHVFTGGAPVFPSMARALTSALPDAHIRIAYGSTEAEPISLIRADEVADMPIDMAGLPVGDIHPMARVCIIKITEASIQLADNEQLTNQSLPSESVGEICVSGPHVLRTYYNNEAAWLRNKILQSDGTLWHRTGDSGYIGPDGRLYLTGRCATLFEWRGRLICPFVYEAWLQAQPGVGMATIVQHHAQVCVVVEMPDATHQAALRAALDARGLQDCQLVILKRIPRDPRHHSKIDYGRLLEGLG
jgi:olefin beta-lactone synthetase